MCISRVIWLATGAADVVGSCRHVYNLCRCCSCDGYHVYKTVWSALVVGDVLQCKWEANILTRPAVTKNSFTSWWPHSMHHSENFMFAFSRACTHSQYLQILHPTKFACIWFYVVTSQVEYIPSQLVCHRLLSSLCHWDYPCQLHVQNAS